MLSFFRHKKSLHFLLIITSLTVAAIGAAAIAEIADRNGDYDLSSISAKVSITLAVVIVLYVISKLAQNISLHSDISLQITNSGLVFSALILLVAILSLSSGNNLLYLVLSVLLSTMFVSLIGSRLSLSGVRVAVKFPDHIFAGERVSFDVTVTNRKRIIPSFSIGVAASEETGSNVEGANLVELAYLPIIPAMTECRSRIERVFAKRGIYPIKGFLVGTRFPLGFIEQRRFVEAEKNIVIYPAPMFLEDFASLVRQTQGSIESRAKGSGSDLYAIRPYLASDHHHHIDWKATAKTATLMVREFTRDDDWRVTIVFDNHVGAEQAGEEAFDQQFERAVSLAAGLIKSFIGEGAEVRLVIGEVDSGYGIGIQHHYSMLRRLAEVAPRTDEVMKEPLSARLGETEFNVLITSDGQQAPSPNTHIIKYDAMKCGV